MPARGKAKRMPRRRPKTIGILNSAEGLYQANIITKLAFNLNPLQFALGDAVEGYTSPNGTSLTELIKEPEKFELVAARVTNPELVVKAGIASAVGNMAFRLGKRFLKRPISQVNSKIMTPLALGVKL
tara:strand:- start:1353 stop:1736 length:384 start_codon:yes stop_codon:yes gene_type:complete